MRRIIAFLLARCDMCQNRKNYETRLGKKIPASGSRPRSEVKKNKGNIRALIQRIKDMIRRLRK